MVPAQAHFQRVNSRGDCDFDHESATFDISPVLDTYDLDSLPIYADELHEFGTLNYGDELYHEAAAKKLVEDWDGPFEFYLTDHSAYQHYLEKRLENEMVTPLTLGDKKTLIKTLSVPQSIGRESEHAFSLFFETFEQCLDSFCDANVTKAEEFINDRLEELCDTNDSVDEIIDTLALIRADMPRTKIMQAQVWLYPASTA